jgi:hypothetical protein
VKTITNAEKEDWENYAGGIAQDKLGICGLP